MSRNSRQHKWHLLLYFRSDEYKTETIEGRCCRITRAFSRSDLLLHTTSKLGAIRYWTAVVQYDAKITAILSATTIFQ